MAYPHEIRIACASAQRNHGSAVVDATPWLYMQIKKIIQKILPFLPSPQQEFAEIAFDDKIYYLKQRLINQTFGNQGTFNRPILPCTSSNDVQKILLRNFTTHSCHRHSAVDHILKKL